MLTVLDSRLTTKIRRLTASRRRADYVEAIATHASELTQVPLSIACDIDTAQAFRDASREEIMLNGVCFVGDHRTEAFVAAIKRIVSRHVDDPDKYLAVTDRVMRGCSRTLSGSDSYFALHELFACPEILVGIACPFHQVVLSIFADNLPFLIACLDQATGRQAHSARRHAGPRLLRSALQMPHQIHEPLWALP
jgi:hypothetical protein